MTVVTLNGHVSATAAAGTVAANLTTTLTYDEIVAIVAWKDTGTRTLTIADVAGLVWTARSPVKANGAYKMQEFVAPSAATLGADTITATFSGATSGHTALIAFGVNYVNNATPFDTNGGLPGWTYTSGAAMTTTGIQTSTDLSPEFLFGAIMLTPSEATTSGTGFTVIESVDATDFRFAAEYVVKTTPQLDLLMYWTFGSEAATAVETLSDSIQQLGASAFPWTVTYEGAKVISTTGEVGEGVAHWYAPVVSTTGQDVTMDMSGGAALGNRVVEAKRGAAKDPRTTPASGDNEND